jgi:hypothetical protein
VKGANILLTTSYRTPREKLMERARSYQASLEAMYINDHPHVGRLIHPDHRRNLQTLLTVSVLRGHPGRWTCREQVEQSDSRTANFVSASSVRHRRLRHRLRPTTAATMPTPTPTPKVSRRCRWQSPPPPSPLCRWGAGAAGPRTWPLPGLPQPLRLNRRGAGRARELECTSKYTCAR